MYGKIIWRGIKIPTYVLQMWMLLSYKKKQKIFVGCKESIHLRRGNLSLEGIFLSNGWVEFPTTERSSTNGKKD